MSSLLFRAWSASKRGDFAQAGQLYRSAGRLEAALEAYIRAGELRAAASVELELGRVFDAAKHLQEAGEKQAAADVLRENRRFLQAAHLYADLGQFPQAAAMAQEAGRPVQAAQYMEAEGKFFEAGEMLAAHREHAGKAMLCFERALQQFPPQPADPGGASEEYGSKRLTIARAFEAGGAPERAAELFEEVGDIASAARCREVCGQLARALELYRLSGNQEKVRGLLSRVGDTSPAVRAEAAAVDGDPAASAKLFLQAGCPEKAAPLLEEAGLLPEAAEAWREVGEWERAGNLFYRAGRFLDAAESFRQAQLYTLALSAYEVAGDFVAASRMASEAGLWEKAYEFAPDAEARRALVKHLQAVPEGAPDRHAARLVLARAFVDLGQEDLASECLRGLPPASSGESPWVDYLSGRCCEAAGEREEAASLYRRVLARDMEFQDASQRWKSLEAPARARVHGGGSRYQTRSEAFPGPDGSWWRGEDTTLGGPVLLLRPSVEGLDGAGRERLRAALRPLLDLRHPSVLGLRDVEEGEAAPTLVYENFDGEPLPVALGAVGGLSPFECIEMFRQVLRLLKECHPRGIVHGMLEADSLLLGKRGEVKVRGYGTAWLGGDGWRGYAAPEVLSGGQAGPAADLFAAGRILLSTLAGQFPAEPLVEGTGPRADRAFPPDLPPRARAILGRVLSTRPERRFSTADEILAELDALDLPPGAIIAERYEIIEELGRGGMGQVFRVKDLHLDEEVALKTLRGKAGMTDAARARFMREIKLTRKVNHPNVIRMFDMGQFRDLTFLTMEYLPGQTLSTWVKQGAGRAASLGEKVRVLTGIASGLAEAHNQGIVHRDLKPQNVILMPGGVPKLLDFGIAYVEEGADLTQEGHFVGSPKYVSPEQVQGKVPDARSDIYCFGLLCYFLMTGEDAFPGDNPTFILMRQIREMPPPPSKVVRVPPSLERLIMSCLAKRPEDRPDTILDVLQLLRAMS